MCLLLLHATTVAAVQRQCQGVPSLLAIITNILYPQPETVCLYIRILVPQFLRYRAKILHPSFSQQEAAHLSEPPI